MKTGHSSIRMFNNTLINRNIFDFMFFSFNSSILCSNLLTPFYILVWDLFSSLDRSLILTNNILILSPLVWDINFNLMWNLYFFFNWDIVSVLFINIVSNSSSLHFSNLFRHFFNSLGLQIVNFFFLSVFSSLVWDHFSFSLIVSIHDFDFSDSRFVDIMGFNGIIIQQLLFNWDHDWYILVFIIFNFMFNWNMSIFNITLHFAKMTGICPFRSMYYSTSSDS